MKKIFLAITVALASITLMSAQNANSNSGKGERNAEADFAEKCEQARKQAEKDFKPHSKLGKIVSNLDSNKQLSIQGVLLAYSMFDLDQGPSDTQTERNAKLDCTAELLKIEPTLRPGQIERLLELLYMPKTEWVKGLIVTYYNPDGTVRLVSKSKE